MKGTFKELRDILEKTIPKFNGRECKNGCNCIEIAEFRNDNQGVKDYPCLKELKIPKTPKRLSKRYDYGDKKNCFGNPK